MDLRVLGIVGKVDTRVLVYTLARALSLDGMTAIITEDGAYRRLYFGNKSKGTVSGVDISVGINIDDADGELRHSLDDSGIQYDNMIIVTNSSVPPDATGVILCKGINKSINEDVDYGGKKDDRDKDKDKEKKRGKNKKQAEVDTDINIDDDAEKPEGMASGDLICDSEIPLEDEIIVSDSIPSKMVHISFERLPKKEGLSIQLKDGFMRYIYNCEERKELMMLDNKGLNKVIADIASEPLGISKNELYTLLTRSEYITGKRIK